MATESAYSAQGIHSKSRQYLAQLDSQLEHIPYTKEFEHLTGIPKTYAALGLGGFGLVLIFFNIAGQLLTNLISWIYPAYASFKALETETPVDDKQWLTYWTVIGFVQIVEYFTDILLFWIPFYFLLKTGLVLWLALPQFRGAEILYTRLIRPFLLNAQQDIDKGADQLRHKISEVAAGVASSVVGGKHD